MKRRRALSKRVAEIVTLEAANVAGRVPPHDLDAEAAVLSACMLNRDAIDKVGDVLKPEHFYSYANRRIYEAILALSAVQAVRIDVDIVSIAGWLRDREILAEVGGVTYLAQLSDATPAVAHVATHAMMVREKWRLRQLIATCQHTAAEGYGDVGVIQEFLDDHERKVFELSATPERTTLVKVSSTLRQCFAQISAAAERGDRITGLSTGYEKFDAKTAGLHAGDLTIVAARPGSGKSSWALNIAVNVAAPRAERDLATGTEIQFPGEGVAVFSLEMPREQLATRMVCSEGRVDLGRLRQGLLQPDDWRRLTEAASFLSALPLWIDDTPAITLQDVRAKVRRLQAEYNKPGQPGTPAQKVGLVIIDYLQLMKGRDDVNSREQEIGEISRGLKQLAKELKIPVVALSQLNRAVETRSTKDKRPQLSDLRESGSLEQDADMVVFIYRDELYFAETTNAKGLAELIIAKQRNGPTGKVMVRFTASCTRFDNLAAGDYPMMEDE
jgi:replicative DNA helicase